MPVVVNIILCASGYFEAPLLSMCNLTAVLLGVDHVHEAAVCL